MGDTVPRLGLVALHHLTLVEEDDGVMVGRPDTGSYALFPPEGARLLRRLAAGASLQSCRERYEEETGEQLDTDDLLEMLDELGFVRSDGQQGGEPPTVRWQRLGRATFSVPAMVLYASVIVGGLVLTLRDPALRPSYENLFFTSNISLVPVVLAFGQFPFMLLHEAYHALAGRRLGLPSTLGIGRRYYFLVAETRLDSLYSVPRRQRYLPFLAGVLLDAVVAATMTLACAGLRQVGGPTWVSGLALAIAFTALLRIAWQGLFYLQTDLYFVIATAARCIDLQGAAKSVATNWWRRLTGGATRPDAGEWSERDLAAARWYAPLLVVGYAISTATLLLVVVPTTVRFWTTVWFRFVGPAMPLGELVDTLALIFISATQLALLASLATRDIRRARRERQARISKGPTS